MYNEVIKLVTVLGSREDEDGYTIEDQTKKVEVFADVKSVKYAEYYAALAANTNAQIIFVMDPLDFELSIVKIENSEHKTKKLRASKVEYDGNLYRIVRIYRTVDNTLELTCAEVE